MYAVVEAVTVADALVYVTSVERYAVAHLIEWLFLLHDAGIDFVECLNKTRRRDQRVVIENQRTTHFPEMARQLGMPAPTRRSSGSATWWRVRNTISGDQTTPRPCSCVTRPWISSRVRTIYKPAAGPSALSSSASTSFWSRPGWKCSPRDNGLPVEAAVQDFVTLYEQAYLQSDQVIEPFSA